jgi:hypothetical protein
MNNRNEVTGKEMNEDGKNEIKQECIERGR